MKTSHVRTPWSIHPRKSILERFGWLSGLFVALLLLARVSPGQTLPANFSQVAVASGLGAPTVIVFAPDGRLFIAQQNGVLRVVKNGTLLPNPFLQLPVEAVGERGLLGIAFDPDFATNNFIYLYYTVPAGAAAVHNRISRFTANGDVALAGSESIILELNSLSRATNHNGGSMVFGADKKLYVGVGENAYPPHAQDLTNYLGKVLRINPDGSVPAGNPFTDGNEARQRIWAYGLRNPYTLAVQPGTGRLFVNDVGQEVWEEINDATTAGANFGWPLAEGVSTNPAFKNPVYAYTHGGGDGTGCAITGGVFFNPASTTYPASYIGTYFFQDFCSNWINVLDLSGPAAVRSSFATNVPGNALSVTVGPDGNLYYASRVAGSVFKVIYTGTACQTINDGNWHDATVWSCGRVPTLNDKATVRHALTIGPSAIGQAHQVQYEAGGRLAFAAGAQLTLGK
ncbi:PQQ-dependent sugar dehydrogenase [Spirosoma fluminis]